VVGDDFNLFEPSLVASIEQRFSMLAPHERPLLWLHATRPDFAPLRAWLDDQLRHFDTELARGFASRLRDADRYTQALAELATGYVFREAGNAVRFEPQLGRLTPDLLITDPEGRQLIIEVWRRGLPRTAQARNKQWTELARHIRRIREPIALAVGSAAQTVVEPPDAPTRRRIEQQLRGWLVSGQATLMSMLEIEGLTFRVVGTTTSSRTEILPVQDGAAVSRKDVVEAIERKVRRYRRLTQQLSLPLLVVLSADPNTALDAALVGSILAGNNSIAVALPLNSVGAIDTGNIELRLTDAPPVFDSALSGVSWLEINDGIGAELDPFWPNPAAARPIELLTPPG
jgi:hypothetical protein